MQLVIVMHLRQKKSLAGKQKTVSVRCVKIPGDGSLIIRRDMKNRMYIMERKRQCTAETFGSDIV